jgi:transcriptional regulator with XRE-family HTH domain
LNLPPEFLVRSFGVAVRQLRDARGWSQEALADHAGLNRSYVGEIERGEVVVSLSTTVKLARAFEMLPSVLVKRGETIAVAQHAYVGRLVAIDG